MVFRRHGQVRGDGEDLIEREHDDDADDPAKTRAALAVLHLLVQVRGDIPAPVVEGRDQAAGREPCHAVEMAQAEPGPGERRHRVRGRVHDGQDREQHQDRYLDPGHDPLSAGGHPHPQDHQRDHYQEPDRPHEQHINGVVSGRSAEQPKCDRASWQRPGDHEDRRGDHQRPARDEAEGRMQHPADPGVAGACVRLDPVQVAERPGDSEHRDAAVEQGGGTGEAHDPDKGGCAPGNRVRGGTARNCHDDRVEQAEHVRAQTSPSRHWRRGRLKAGGHGCSVCEMNAA